MTEAKWIASTWPGSMVAFVSGRTTDRKLRLFACACCRHIWDRLPDEYSRLAVMCAERFADGAASVVELEMCRRRARSLSFERRRANQDDPGQYTLLAAADTCCISAHSAATSADLDAAWQAPDGNGDTICWAEKADQAYLVRDIFGNPFRPVPFDSHWRTADTLGLARGIYEDRAFDRLPILADALMDAGCDNSEIFDHCRGEGHHVRGCWVVDLGLGKE